MKAARKNEPRLAGRGIADEITGSAPIVAPRGGAGKSDAEGSVAIAPRLPRTHASVVAEVLARLLNGERLTSLDAVAGASTTRLAALVHYLGSVYGWPIDREEKAAPCRDGRVAWVTEYYLPTAVTMRAIAAGAADWCATVRTARAAQRSAAADASRRATEANARLPGGY